MYKNIVFDMGKVLLDYDAMKVCRHFTDNEQDARLILEALFRSPEWIELDRGTITEDDAMTVVYERLATKKLKDQAKQCMEHWHEYNIWPMRGMEEVVKLLKEKGFRLYLLSNCSHRLRVFMNEIPGMKYFDGVIVSAEELCIKPDKKIYDRLFEKYNILPQESFFIDDLQENIDGAKSLGMNGYCFADGDVKRLKKYLMEEL